MTSVRRLVPRPVRAAIRRIQVDLADRLAWRNLTRAVPTWEDIGGLARSEVERLAVSHKAYVTDVSAPEAAVSLETAGLLSAVCRQMKPERVLDLGSGFSSIVLGGCAPTLSIDDDPAWRGRTEAYAAATGASVTIRGLEALDGETPFDLVFFDLGGMATRRTWLGRALDLTRCVAVLDDAHKPGYESAVREAVKGRNGALYSLAHHTRDSFGRYALVWTTDVRPGAADPGRGP